MKGKFITIEGIEGVGKSTNLDFARRHLDAAGKKVVVTREPGGTPLGEDIRTLLLAHRVDGMSHDAELLLMFAARAEHLARVIRPALEAGQWILCDRFTDASYAYQGGGRGIAPERIAQLEEWVQGDLRPDLTLLLDVPAEIGLSRAVQRGGEPDRFEREQAAFFERVRHGYLELARRYPQRFRCIDATRDISEVQSRLRTALDDFLAQVK
ncbi:MAG: dTMP kinase [Gammaproteobacteria bacterium]|nr:dTMP kinase [Gammaproteobacteria bacterium]